MEWLIQGIITSMVCSFFQFIWKKINSISNVQNIQKTKYTSIKFLKMQTYISLILVLFTEFCILSFNTFLNKHTGINCLLFIVLFYSFFALIGGINMLIKNNLYYESKYSSNKQSKNKE